MSEPVPKCLFPNPRRTNTNVVDLSEWPSPARTLSSEGTRSLHISILPAQTLGLPDKGTTRVRFEALAPHSVVVLDNPFLFYLFGKYAPMCASSFAIMRIQFNGFAASMCNVPRRD